MRYSILFGAILVSVVATQPAMSGDAAEVELGVLRGQFVFDGEMPETIVRTVRGKQYRDDSLLVDESGGIANIFVYAFRMKANDIIPKEVETSLRIQVVDELLSPRCYAIWGGRQVLLPPSFENTDEPHGFFAADIRRKRMSASWGDHDRPIIDVDHIPQSSPARILCSIHPQEVGFVLVSDNPLFAISNTAGGFSIEGIPLNLDLEFYVWHEKAGRVVTEKWPKGRFRIRLSESRNEVDLGVVKLPPSLFEANKEKQEKDDDVPTSSDAASE